MMKLSDIITHEHHFNKIVPSDNKHLMVNLCIGPQVLIVDCDDDLYIGNNLFFKCNTDVVNIEYAVELVSSRLPILKNGKALVSFERYSHVTPDMILSLEFSNLPSLDEQTEISKNIKKLRKLYYDAQEQLYKYNLEFIEFLANNLSDSQTYKPLKELLLIKNKPKFFEQISEGNFQDVFNYTRELHPQEVSAEYIQMYLWYSYHSTRASRFDDTILIPLIQDISPIIDLNFGIYRCNKVMRSIKKVISFVLRSRA